MRWRRFLGNVLQRQFVDLRVQALQVNALSGRFACVSAKDPGGAFEKLGFPLSDHVELRANSASVFSPFRAAKATFALKDAVWFRRGLLLIVSPELLARCQADVPLIVLSEFPGPPLWDLAKLRSHVMST